MAYPAPKKLGKNVSKLALFEAIDASASHPLTGWGLETSSGASTITLDDTYAVNGSTAIRLDWDVDASGNDHYVQLRREFPTPIDLTGLQTIGVLVYIEGASEADVLDFWDTNNPEIRFHTTASSNNWNNNYRRYRASRNYNSSSNHKLGYWWITAHNDTSLTPVSDAGTFDVTDVDGMSIEWEAAAGTTSKNITIHHDVIVADAKPSRVPRVALTIDDGNASDFTEAYNYVYTTQSYNFPFTSFIDSVTVDGGIGNANAQTMHTNGWAFGIHGDDPFPNNESGSATPSLATVISDFQSWASTNSITRGIKSGSYPQSQQNLASRQRLYDNGITSMRAGLSRSSVDHCPVLSTGGFGLDDPLRMPSLGFAGQASTQYTTGADFHALLAVQRQTGCDAIYTWHEIVASGATGNQTNRADFQSQMQILKQWQDLGLIEIVYMHDMLSEPASGGIGSGRIIGQNLIGRR